MSALVVGAVISVVSGLISSSAAKKAGRARKRAAEKVAIQFEDQARQIENQGELLAADAMTETLAALSNIRAAGAASGIAAGSGSIENSRLMQRREAGRKLAILRSSTSIAAGNSRAQAANARAGGKVAMSEANAQATASIMSGISNAVSMGVKA